jgi:hypothetical protein
MAEVAHLLIAQGDIDEAKEMIDAVVTREELEYLHELGLEDYDGRIDKAEFIILCMIRMGTDPGLIQYIIQRFGELNFYTGEALTIAEITQGACKFVKGRIRRIESTPGEKFRVVSEQECIVPEESKSYLDYYHRTGHDDNSSRAFDNFAVSPCQRLESDPALPTVEEDETSEKVARQEHAQSKPTQKAKQSTDNPRKDWTAAVSVGLIDIYNRSVDSSGFLPTALLRPERDPKNLSNGETHGGMDVSSLSADSLDHRQRRGTLRPSIGIDLSSSETRTMMDAFDQHRRDNATNPTGLEGLARRRAIQERNF